METLFFNNIKIENHTDTPERLNIEGYICHFLQKNLNDEVVDKNSFDEFFEMYGEGKITPVVNYNHDQNQIIGGVESIETKEDGLYMKAFLNKEVKINSDMIIPNILAGTISGFSTEGFIKDGWDGIVELENGGYYVKSFLLTSVAVTATPADWEAKFSLSNFIKEYREHKNQVVEEIKNSLKWYQL
jgi:HK97 family phage prohead protease